MRLKGKVCVVTAAGQGIGAATARAFAKEGATVWAINGGDPVNKAVYSDPEVLKVRKDFPLMAETMTFATLFPRIPHTEQLRQVWAREINLAADVVQHPERLEERFPPAEHHLLQPVVAASVKLVRLPQVPGLNDDIR